MYENFNSKHILALHFSNVYYFQILLFSNMKPQAASIPQPTWTSIWCYKKSVNSVDTRKPTTCSSACRWFSLPPIVCRMCLLVEYQTIGNYETIINLNETPFSNNGIQWTYIGIFVFGNTSDYAGCFNTADICTSVMTNHLYRGIIRHFGLGRWMLYFIEIKRYDIQHMFNITVTFDFY